MKTNDTPLLQLKNLTTVFPTKRGLVTAVNQVNLRVAPGEILGIVGESGCGKSTVLLSILRLIARPGRIAAGEIIFRGQNLRRLPKKAMRSIRGKEISMIFQDPLSTLNPVFPVGEQIREALRLHGIMNRGSAALPWPLDGARRALEKKRVLEVMAEVGIPAPEARYRAYPHEFSGGMQQRALIAIGLACEPAILLADEPTTALDVTIQAQVLALIDRLKRELGMGVILITHDLGVVAEWAQRVMVMYAGRKVEEADVESFFRAPIHPYSRALMASVPRPELAASGQSHDLAEIPGTVPPLDKMGPGCAFATRCEYTREACRTAEPALRPLGSGRVVACVRAEDFAP